MTPWADDLGGDAGTALRRERDEARMETERVRGLLQSANRETEDLRKANAALRAKLQSTQARLAAAEKALDLAKCALR